MDNYNPGDVGSILQYLKLANIFAPQIADPAVPSGINPYESSAPMLGATQPVDANSINPMIQEMLQPSTGQFDKLVSNVDSMPVREEPGMWRKILGGISTLATDDPVSKQMLRDDVKYGNYNRDLRDWSNKTGSILETAKLEGSRNTNDRLTGASILRDERDREKQDLNEKKAADAAIIAREKLAIQQQRANAYEYRIKHPNKVFKTNDANELIAIDPQSGEAEPVIDDEGNPIKTDSLTASDKIKLQIAGRLETIKAAGDESRKTEGVRQENRLATEGVRQENRLELKTTPGASSDSTDNMSPAEIRTDRINRIIDLVTKDPTLKQYFVYGGNGAPTGEMVAPKGGVDENYKKAQATIEGKSDNVKLKPDSAKATTAPVIAAKAKVEPGYVLITDGKNFGQVKKGTKIPAPWKVVE